MTPDFSRLWYTTLLGWRIPTCCIIPHFPITTMLYGVVFGTSLNRVLKVFITVSRSLGSSWKGAIGRVGSPRTKRTNSQQLKESFPFPLGAQGFPKEAAIRLSLESRKECNTVLLVWEVFVDYVRERGLNDNSRSSYLRRSSIERHWWIKLRSSKVCG